MPTHIHYLFLLFLAFACGVHERKSHTTPTLPPTFGDYWYQGKAELASYDLQQVRYGELRDGQAVLIFVTEDFLLTRQVKPDHPGEAADAIKVLKLNATRKFNTGIYPYSTMTSVFTPVYLHENPSTIKLTTSVQEWCGHTFLQANLTKNAYKIQGHSYFEKEGEQEYTITNTWMEDEIWNSIRINPKGLPIGKVEMLPSSLYSRLKHIRYQPYLAEATFTSTTPDTSVYQISYPEMQRVLKIKFDPDFPHGILAWEESYPEGGEIMTSKATLKKSLLLDYWNKNSEADSIWRRKLELPGEE
ncbi:MAG: hypothetical protein HC819_22705 [Cyclobacteriaceae bacterium]|nr:hypothetical protein [Cyclobacteriaceae bacterium]